MTLILLGGGGGGYVPPSAPPKPAVVNVVDGVAELVVSWATGGDGGSPLTGYVVEWTPEAGSKSSASVGLDASPYTITGLTNGVSYTVGVKAVNAVGVSEAAVSSGTPISPTAEPPVPVPNLDITGATTVGTSDNVANLVSAGSDNDVFYFPNGTYTNFGYVEPKDGMRFIGQSRAGVIVQGNGSVYKAFLAGRSSTAGAQNVVIANMRFTKFGGGVGLYDQNHAVIDGHSRSTAGTGYLTQVSSDIDGKDWHLHNIQIDDSSNLGVFPGHRWKITSSFFYTLSPHAIGGGFTTGLYVQDCYFFNNGIVGAQGGASNRSQVKIAWNNIGPYGDSSRDTAPHSGNMTEPLQRTKFYGNTFEGNTTNLRHLWFDLDVRDTEVAWNIFRDAQSFCIFHEGSNNSWIHHNTFEDSGDWWGATANAYNSAGALCTASSDNILIEDNTFTRCQGMFVFLGERGRGGGDWACGGFYPVVCLGQMTDSLAPLSDPTARSTWGTSYVLWRNNDFVDCGDIGVIRDTRMTTGELNLGTHEFSGNTYDAATQADRFWWNNTQQSYAAWQSDGRQ